MKYFLILIIISGIALQVGANDYTTNSSGTWTDASKWDLAGYPDDASDNALVDNNDDITLPGTGVTITIGVLQLDNNAILTIPLGDKLICDSIAIINRADLFIDGELVVTGGVSMQPNSLLNLDASGTVAIGGDFEGSNNVDLQIDGTMSVEGDFTLGNGSSITGGGSIAVNGNINVPGGVGTGILPIELLYFKASQLNNQVVINWATASELNNAYFTIEKSFDGINYTVLDYINGSGTTSMTNEYSYTDNSEGDQQVYYRLTQTDFDGQAETFPSIVIETDNTIVNETLKIFSDKIVSQFYTYSSDIALAQIVGVNGEVVKQKEIRLDKGFNEIFIDLGSLNRGVYILNIESNTFNISKKFVN